MFLKSRESFHEVPVGKSSPVLQRFEFESTGFPYQNCCNRNLISNHQVNKQKLTSHYQSVKW